MKNPIRHSPHSLMREAAFRLAGDVFETRAPAGEESLWRRYLSFLDREMIVGKDRETATAIPDRDGPAVERASAILFWIALSLLAVAMLAGRAGFGPPHAGPERSSAIPAAIVPVPVEV